MSLVSMDIAMWLFHSRQLMLNIFILYSFLEFIHAKHKPKSKNSQLQSNEAVCSKEEVLANNSSYIWKQKYSTDRIQYATSEGTFCLNNSTNELLIRKCDLTTGEWMPPASSVKCVNIQKQQNTFCPEDLIEISIRSKFICLKISDGAHAFNESFCYGSDTLFGENSMEEYELNAILEHLSERRRIKNFWLPVRRAAYNKYYNPFVIRLPGSKWGKLYEMQDLFAVEDCLSVEIIDLGRQLSFVIQISDCTKMLPSVCIHRKEFVAYSGCPQGFGALAYRPNECYGIEWEAGLFPYDLRALSITEYILQKNSLQYIFDSVALDRNRFFLIGNFSDENNTNFDIEMNRKEVLRIVPFGGKRHALSCEHLTNLNRKTVEMILSFNQQLEGLTLTIYNRNYIWRFSDSDNFGVKCFTNAKSENLQWKSIEIKLLWQNTLETKALFELKQEKNDGYYWCEAHTIFDFALVQTKKILINKPKKGHTYAFLLRIPCQPRECYNIFSSEVWKRMNKNVKKLLIDLKETNRNHKMFEDLEITNIRLMDISQVFNNSIEVLVHASAYLKSLKIEQGSLQSSEEFESEEVESSVKTSARIKTLILFDELLSIFYSEQVHLVRSTMFCFPEVFYMDNEETNFWQMSKYGQASTTFKLCLHKTGVPITRLCLGDFLWGAFWENFNVFERKGLCSQPTQYNVITYQLQDIEAKKLSKEKPSKAVRNVRNLLENNLDNIIPADFYYISRIMHSTMKTILKNDNSSISEVFSAEIARVYDFLMEVNEGVVKPSVTLNSTNVLLEAFERMIDQEAIQAQTKISQKNSSNTMPTSLANDTLNKNDGITIIQYEDIGVEVKIATNFVIFIIDPYVKNVTGVALYHNESSEISEETIIEGQLLGSFKNEFYRFIISEQSVDDLLYEDNLQLATYVPRSLWNRLDEISRLANFTNGSPNSTRFVIKIYANDVLFQDNENSSDGSGEKSVAGKIVSVSIPGHDKDLPEMLPLIFKVNSTDNSTTETSCSYWNYDTWANDGLTFLGRSEADNSIILCGCTHLTPFAYLIGDNYKLSVDSDIVVLVKTHQKVLDIITILGCSLSLFGTFGIFITAATFQSWRQKASSKVLLQLSAAISLQMVLFCFVNTEKNSNNLMEYDVILSCIAIGALLHYSVLVQFSWMIIIGYLQFKRYVQVFGNTRPKRFLKKSSIIGWGAPLIPVAMVLIFDRKSYIPGTDNADTQVICYPSGLSLYFGVILPITAIIIANLIIFSIIVYNILRGPEGTLRHTEKGLALSQLRLSALLFFLLGFTWIFGLLATLKAGIIFSYLFCLTATLQGFVIFIYFVILDPKTRRMWRGIFINICGLKENYESSNSMKETTQSLR